MALGKMAERQTAPAAEALAAEDIPADVTILLEQVEGADGNRRAYFEGALDPAQTVHVKAWLGSTFLADHSGGEICSMAVETKGGKAARNVATDERRSHERREGSSTFRRPPVSVSKDGKVAIVELVPTGSSRSEALVVLYAPADATVHTLNVVLAG